MPGEHAKLSASGAHRWLNCPLSYVLTKDLGEESSPFAEEGTRAHSCCEYLLRTKTDMFANSWLWLEPSLERPKADNREMELCADSYLEFVIDKMTQNIDDDPCLFVEERVRFDKWVEGGFGTSDCLILTDRKIIIVDFKYGKGVKVDAPGNPQLRLYALGALAAFPKMPIREVEMNIFQPRIDRISTATESVEDLLEFGKVCKKASRLALSGKGKAHAGEWCRFCQVNAICRERARRPLQTISQIMEVMKKKKEEITK